MSEGTPPPGGNLPARRVSSQELEAIIRRAVEIQSAAGGDEAEGIPEAEVLRIGRELGLEPSAVRRAIADVRGRPPAEHGVLARAMGPKRVLAARTIRRPAASVGLFLEQYLVTCEYMVVHRRFPDRTRYVASTGIGAAMGRAVRKVQERQATLDVTPLDVAVSVVDEDTCFVEVSTDLGNVRGGLAAGAAVGGGGGAAAIVTAVLATPIVDPLALVALPVLGGMYLGMRGIFGVVSRSTQEKLEAFLDRLEHGELRLPSRKPDWRKQLGI